MLSKGAHNDACKVAEPRDGASRRLTQPFRRQEATLLGWPLELLRLRLRLLCFFLPRAPLSFVIVVIAERHFHARATYFVRALTSRRRLRAAPAHEETRGARCIRTRPPPSWVAHARSRLQCSIEILRARPASLMPRKAASREWRAHFPDIRPRRIGDDAQFDRVTA